MGGSTVSTRPIRRTKGQKPCVSRVRGEIHLASTAPGVDNAAEEVTTHNAMIILVVGMHRSGTSLVARGLHAMGANLGERIDTEPHPANPHGHWEHADVWRAQERLLIRFGREWHSSPGPLPPRWMEWPDTQETIDRFVAIARAEVAARGHWLVKDPRSSLLIPLWKAVARRVDTTLRILRIYRGVDEVVASLADRNGMPRDFAARIWVNHQRSIDRDTAGLESRTFRHDAILRDPQSAFAEMGDFCGLPDAAGCASSAAALVDPSLWHQRHPVAPDRDATADDALVPPDVELDPPDLGRVLVVMRTRWRIHMLPRAIRSVLSQTYPNWFLQIVNDGGPPHLVESEVLPYRRLLLGRLGILHLDRQHGMEAASNAGIAAAAGDFIAIHDDDDTWSPDFLARMVAKLQTGGHAAVVSRSRMVWERWTGGDHVPQRMVECGPTSERVTAADLAERNQFPPIAFLFRRQVYDEVGPFHEGLPALGDWHFNRRVATRAPIEVHPETLASWHLREPADSMPNSPRVDHWRSDQFVRSWPDVQPLPEFFGQARQVRLWGEGTSLDGFQRMPLPGSGSTAEAAAEPLLPAGIYLVRFPFPGEHASDAVDHGSFRAVLAGGAADRETVPLVARAGEHAAVLLNARQPILALGLQAGSGPVELLPAATELVRLGDPLGQFEDFAGPPRLPDVLCIGAQRAGTTWLHAALQSHPYVWPSEIKEFHQFDWDGRDSVVGEFRQRQALAALKGFADGTAGPDREHQVRRLLRHAFPPAHSWENYASMFASAPPDRLACDFTPAYATLDESQVDDIVRMMPHIKVIFILRDPVTRAVSGAIHDLGMAGITAPTEAELLHACLDASNVLRTDYLRTLDLWRRTLPEGRLLVLFHDDIARDPEGVVNRTCDFLGIDPPPSRGDGVGSIALPRNSGRATVAWPELARVKAALSVRWLPMLVELDRRFGEPFRQWRLAAEARQRAAEAARLHAGAGGDNTVVDNLAQWDMQDPWPKDGDEWDGQARACGVAYEDWKAGITARYGPLLATGGTVLELGPGHGRWSDWLIERAGLLVLCDISPNCLDACRSRLAGRGRVRTHVSQGDDLPADLTGQVDAVWSYDCLVHVGPQECERYLSEIARVLRPGGIAVVHHADRPSGRLAHVVAAVRSWIRGKSDATADHGWRSRVSRRDVRRWARQAGLTVDRQETTWDGHLPSGTHRIGVPRFGDCITVLRRAEPMGPKRASR